MLYNYTVDELHCMYHKCVELQYTRARSCLAPLFQASFNWLHLTYTLAFTPSHSNSLIDHLSYYSSETGKSVQYRVSESYCHLLVRKLSTSDWWRHNTTKPSWFGMLTCTTWTY